MTHRFLKIPLSSFGALNITQFLTALNDNFYKLLLIFFLIHLKGVEESTLILALAGAIFVIPFLLFASLAGSLADRLAKRTLIYFTRLMEILSTALGVVAFAFQSALGGYCVLFLMATHSALFSPCKYGILPEILPAKEISRCNGIMTATTYLAIIFGTFLASFLTEVTDKNFVLCALFSVVIASIGFLISLAIEKTHPQAAQKEVSVRFLREIFRTLTKARERHYLLTSLICGAYFLFMGAYTQLNIIPFTIHSLHLTEVQGGYLFLLTAIGIGIGAYCAGRVSASQVELGLIPLAAFGVAFCFLGLYLGASHFLWVAILLIAVGIFGGFYIVPLDSFIQLASPDRDRGQNVATANFLSFVGVILASGLLALLGNGWGLTAAAGFGVMAAITAVIGVVLMLLYADQLLRLLVAKIGPLFFRIEVTGENALPLQSTLQKRPLLLVASRQSWIDTLIIMAVLPRLVRYIVPLNPEYVGRSLLYRLLWLVPVEKSHFSPLGPPALKAIGEELTAGRPVCLMQPIASLESLALWESELEALVKEVQAPVMSLHIRRPSLSSTSSLLAQLSQLRHTPILISCRQPKEQ